jgi:hypothetical protein
MRCSACGVALPVFGLLSAVAVFAAQTTTTTGSDLTPAGGMVLASTRGVSPLQGVEAAKAEAPAAVNMNDWQETAIRRGSVRRL